MFDGHDFHHDQWLYSVSNSAPISRLGGLGGRDADIPETHGFAPEEQNAFIARLTITDARSVGAQSNVQ